MDDIVIIRKADFVLNHWSGGATTQVAISPKDASLANRDFTWRISSATFTDTSSRFSDFSGYQRCLLPLKGDIYLKHQGKYDTTLKPYDVEYFLGSWTTDSTNSLGCRDFNLIVKEGIDCNLVVAKEQTSYIPKRCGTLCLFSLEAFELDVFYDEVKTLKVEKEALIIIKEQDILNKLHITTLQAPVIICEIGAM